MVGKTMRPDEMTQGQVVRENQSRILRNSHTSRVDKKESQRKNERGQSETENEKILPVLRKPRVKCIREGLW